MKIKSIIIFLLLLNIGCSAGKVFFNSGKAVIKNDIETIEIEIINDLPFCQVNINNKEYKFLIDTGAPTVISEEIYKEMNLKVAHTGSVGDSQNKKQTQKFAVLPKITMGNLVFENIGSVALKLENQELECFGFDGIIGSNMLSKLYWKFDYQNNKIYASNQLSNYKTDTYDFTLNFKPKAQKTPIIKGRVKDKDYDFTFDTGFAGNIKIPNDYEYYQNLISEENFITTTGINSIGLYGSSENEKTFAIKDNLVINNLLFENELMASGQSTLIGNEFLKNYTFVLDWVENKIYLKKNLDIEPKKLKGFGFSYLFMEGKPVVVSRIENQNISIQHGDEILSINDTDFTKLKDSDICQFFLNKVEKDESEIMVKLKRENDTLNLHLKKRIFLE